jgi:hypothetical protein
MGVSDAKRLKALESENARLKKMLAEALLENEVTNNGKEFTGRAIQHPAADAASGNKKTAPAAGFLRSAAPVRTCLFGVCHPDRRFEFLEQDRQFGRHQRKVGIELLFFGLCCRIFAGLFNVLEAQLLDFELVGQHE